MDELVNEFVALLLNELGAGNFAGLDNIDEDGLLNVGGGLNVNKDLLFNFGEGVNFNKDDFFNFGEGVNVNKDDFFNIGDGVNGGLAEDLSLGGDDLVNEDLLLFGGEDDLVFEGGHLNWSSLDDIDELGLVLEDGLSHINDSGAVAELVDGEDVVSGCGDGVISDFRVDDVDELVVGLERVDLGVTGLLDNIESGSVLLAHGWGSGVGGALDFLLLDGWVGDEDVSLSVFDLIVVDSGCGGPVVESSVLSLLDIGDGLGGGSILSEWSLDLDVLVVGVENGGFPGSDNGGEEGDSESLHLD